MKPKLKTLTWEDFKQFNPRHNLEERYGEFSGTILDILQNERISNEDKIWAFTREGIVDTPVLQIFAIRCAKSVKHLMEDPRSVKALEVAERYINGKATAEELEKAIEAAVRAAAWAAARAAETAAMAAVTAAWAASPE